MTIRFGSPRGPPQRRPERKERASLWFVARDDFASRERSHFGIESAPQRGIPHLFTQEYHSREVIFVIAQECHFKGLAGAVLSRAIFLQYADSNRVPSIHAFDDTYQVVHVVQGYDSRKLSFIVTQECHFRRVTVRSFAGAESADEEGKLRPIGTSSRRLGRSAVFSCGAIRIIGSSSVGDRTFPKPELISILLWRSMRKPLPPQSRRQGTRKNVLGAYRVFYRAFFWSFIDIEDGTEEDREAGFSRTFLISSFRRMDSAISFMDFPRLRLWRCKAR
jgi:hypothetical protein